MIDERFDDDYLWDRTGEPDAELRDLERLLSIFRHDQPLQPPTSGSDGCDESDT